MTNLKEEIGNILYEMDNPEGGGEMNWDGEYTRKVLQLFKKWALEMMYKQKGKLVIGSVSKQELVGIIEKEI